MGPEVFIIPFPPQYRTLSLFSRTTRLMLAYDPEYLDLMKDYWKPEIADIHEKKGNICTT
jgi:hypothetical protein